MQRLDIGSPLKIRGSNYHFRNGVVGCDSEHAAQPPLLFSIAPKGCTISCNRLQHPKISRVKFSGALKASRRLLPVALTPLDEAGEEQYLRIIWQRSARNFQLSQSTVVIDVSPVKIPRARQVRFACIRTESRGPLNGSFRQGQTRGRTVVAEEIKRVVNKGELA